MSANLQKLGDLILYLGNSPHVENLGKTKLWKLIYFIDVAFLRTFGSSLTNSEYIKYPHGPVPSRGDKSLKKLERTNLVDVNLVDYGSYRHNHITTITEPNINFTPEEITLIDEVCQKYGTATANYLSEISHLEPAWSYAKEEQKLSPELMHYGYEEDAEGL